MKRFDEVVIRAAVETGDAIGHTIACREDEDGRRIARRSPFPAETQPVPLRQAKIEHNQVIGVNRDEVRCFVAVRRAVGRVPLFSQSGADQAVQPRFILDNKHAQWSAFSPMRHHYPTTAGAFYRIVIHHL